MKPVNYNALDPGIRRTVRWLRDAGFDTIDSGDGVTKAELIAEGYALDVPHVYVRANPDNLAADARSLMDFVRAAGFRVSVCHRRDRPITSFVIIATYNAADDTATVCLVGLGDSALGETLVLTPAGAPEPTQR